MSIDEKKFLLNYIDKLKNDLTIQKLFAKNGLDLDIIDYIPLKIENLNVSAKTDHGIISLNKQLFNKNDETDILGYLCHEITHFIQQCFGNEGTKNSNDGHYLENEFEQEAFQNQIEHISNNKSDEEAEDYVDNLLDYHEIDDKKRNKIQDILLAKV